MQRYRANLRLLKVRKAARAVTKLYEEVLRPIGLRATQFSLLMATRVMGPVTVVKLAQVTVMDRTTLTRNLQILEKRGLIAIKPGEDRREREINLTAVRDGSPDQGRTFMGRSTRPGPARAG